MTGSPFLLAGGAIVVTGLILGIVASILNTRGHESGGTSAHVPPRLDVECGDESSPALWTRFVTSEEDTLSVQDRLEMIARLEMVREKWCTDALRAALDEERDPQVNAAARDALGRLGST